MKLTAGVLTGVAPEGFARWSSTMTRRWQASQSSSGSSDPAAGDTSNRAYIYGETGNESRVTGPPQFRLFALRERNDGMRVAKTEPARTK